MAWLRDKIYPQKKTKKKLVNFMPYEQNPTDVITVGAVSTKTSPYN